MSEVLSLVNSIRITIILAVLSLIIGLILAIIFTLWESVNCRIISWIASAVLMILRGLPEILVILFIYFGSLQLLLFFSEGFIIKIGILQVPIRINAKTFNISPFFCGIISLSLIYAAYASQILRGALKIVPVGQWESGKALGLSKKDIFFRLIIPQAWCHALPGLGNQWLILLKDTALVSLININDLMSQTENISIRTQKPFTCYVIAALIYLIITIFSQCFIRRISLYVERFK